MKAFLSGCIQELLYEIAMEMHKTQNISIVTVFHLFCSNIKYKHCAINDRMQQYSIDLLTYDQVLGNNQYITSEF